MEEERLCIQLAHHWEIIDTMMERKIAEQIINGIIEDMKDCRWYYSEYSEKGIFKHNAYSICMDCTYDDEDYFYCEECIGNPMMEFENELISVMLEVMEYVEFH